MTVLIIDNEEDIQVGMASLMENWHCTVLTAGSQFEAARIISDIGHFPDAVIADYHLDNNDTGLELLNSMKRDHKPNFPAMIITADRTDEIRASIASHGYAHLTKPLKPAKLRAWLSHIASQSSNLL